MNNKFKNYFFFILAGVLLPTIALAQNTVTFTNAAATGRTGPTQAQVTAAYDGTTLDDAVTINTQGIQEWTVPATAVYTIEAIGAGGGNGDSPETDPGSGAKIKGDFTLTSGTVLKILVGQIGSDGSTSGSAGGGGGGGTFVTKSPYNTDASILVIAGGGNGDSWNYFVIDAPDALTTNSGSGGGAAYGRGGGGGGFSGNGTTNSGGGGISFIGGGHGGAKYSGGGDGGFGGGGGSLYEGGGGGGYTGGSVVNTNSYSTSYPQYGSGSYNTASSNQSNTAGANDGHGQVVITYCTGMCFASIAKAAANSYVDVTFTEGAYNANGGSGALET